MLTYSRGETPFAVDPATLDDKAKAYLLQYGWAQSLQDSIAGAAKAKETELRATDQFKAMPEGEQAQFLADEIELHILGKLDARMKAIIDGTIGARVAQPRDEVTVLAREQIRAALAKAGKKIDVKTEAGKAQFDKLVSDHITKSGDKLRAEIARRKEASVEVEIEI